MRRKILRNMIRCNCCGDVIESTYRHDFKYCRCGLVAVDGGHDYLRRCAVPGDFTELSVTEAVEEDGPVFHSALSEDEIRSNFRDVDIGSIIAEEHGYD